MNYNARIAALRELRASEKDTATTLQSLGLVARAPDRHVIGCERMGSLSEEELAELARIDDDDRLLGRMAELLGPEVAAEVIGRDAVAAVLGPRSLLAAPADVASAVVEDDGEER